ncbi:MAG: DUF3330 domain-containing protein [Betaproteobacteria bacterium]|nr:DUF3330 domain-containing protein [Betaproteobacteria bacterium]
MSASQSAELTATQLAQAAERGQLELHYQPIVGVRTVIQLAHGLGMDVVAEGVETPASLAQLRQLDCDAVQGFLFARPMPAEAFVGFVTRWRSDTMSANDPATTNCCGCRKEIPLDAAFTPEGAENVEHFCGLPAFPATV